MTITSPFVSAGVPGNARAIASEALVDSGFPTTCESELSPCSEVATSASAASTATPQSAKVRRGRAADARASLSVNPISTPLSIVRFGSSGAYVMLEGHVKSSAHSGLLRRARPGRPGRDDLLRHEAEGVALGRVLLELPALAAVRGARPSRRARPPRRGARGRRSPTSRLLAHDRGPEGARRVGARAHERTAADPRQRTAQALLRRRDERRRDRWARAGAGGSAPRATRRLRVDRGRHHEPEPR